MYSLNPDMPDKRTPDQDYCLSVPEEVVVTAAVPDWLELLNTPDMVSTVEALEVAHADITNAIADKYGFSPEIADRVSEAAYLEASLRLVV